MSSARDAILSAIAQCPSLTIDGLGGEERPDFDARRAALLSAEDQFERAYAWLAATPRRRMPNRQDGHSYFVKHAIERWAGDYVSNGATLAAAAHLGISIAQCPSRVNAWLGIASRRKWPSRR
jgi:hypothetical protein